jgi:urea carboxylase system permease
VIQRFHRSNMMPAKEAIRGMDDEMTQVDRDQANLEALGYRQRLKRSLNTFDSFAFIFSYNSEISNLAIILGLGLALGGAAFMWAWPIVVCGMLLVTLLFCEMAAHYPVAGSAYNWSKAFAKHNVTAWLTGWLVVIAVIVSFASIAPAFAQIMPQLWHGFQLVGNGSGRYDFSENVVVLGAIATAFSCLMNSISAKAVSRINKIGVRVEIGAGLVFAIVFLIKARRGPGVIFHTFGTGAGHGAGYLGAFLAASIACIYSLSGMDAASDMAEETVNPRKVAPRSMLYGVAGAAITFFVIGVTALMAVPNPVAPTVLSGGFATIVLSVFGPAWGRVALVVVLMALISAALAVQAFAIRVVFGMARDKKLPGASRLARVSSTTGTPIFLTVLIGVIAVVILLVNIRQPQIIGVISSVTIGFFYLAYLGVAAPMLMARFRGDWPPAPDQARSYFSLGRWGYPVTIAAVIYLAAGFINIAWPRSEIYNAAAPFHWYLKWSGFLIPAIALAIGGLLYGLYERHQTGVVAEHAVEVVPIHEDTDV